MTQKYEITVYFSDRNRVSPPFDGYQQKFIFKLWLDDEQRSELGDLLAQGVTEEIVADYFVELAEEPQSYEEVYAELTRQFALRRHA
jgi:hypothetical protein